MRLSLVAKLVLAIEIAADYVRIRQDLRAHDLTTVLARVRSRRLRTRVSLGADAVGRLDTARLGAAVRRTLGVGPADSRCLMQSLVLSSLLARRGMASSLVIGVVPGEAFAAHAWVEQGGRPLLPPGEAQFQRLVEL